MPQPRSTRKATKREVHLIGRMLDQVLKTITPATETTPAFVEYIDGYDDAMVAGKCSENNDPPLPPAAVADLRVDFYGTIKPVLPPDPLERFNEQFIDLHAQFTDSINAQNVRITDVQNLMRLLVEQVNQLIANLATNKIANVGHLMMQSKDGSIPGVARAPHGANNGG